MQPSVEPVAQPIIVVEEGDVGEANVMDIQVYEEGLLGSRAVSLRGSGSHEEDDESEVLGVRFASEEEWRALPAREQVLAYLEEVTDEVADRIEDVLRRRGNRAALRELEVEIARRGWEGVFYGSEAQWGN